jgi:dihydrofolate synthase/folylpolyglutamate synthase
MTYKQAVDYIHSHLKFGSQLGLERISMLLECLGNPQDDLKFVHVAGTNGKGSTTTMCSNILKRAGLRVGMYTSPYVVDFAERFQINGEMIRQNEFIDLVKIIKPEIEKLNKKGVIITEFEIITAMAFLYFKKYNCDIVCLEVGLGGLYDATNVIKDPLVCLIMSISLDHTQVLGNTIYEISKSKVGIIKENTFVVSYPNQHEVATRVLKEQVGKTNSKLLIPNKENIKILSSDLNGSKFLYKDEEYFVPLVGEHQVYNAVVAIEAMRILNKQEYYISQQHIIEGLKSVKFPARFEVLAKSPLVVIDGSHNYDGAQSLYKIIEKFKEKRIVAIVGMLADKDYENTLKLICPLISKVITVPVNNPRGLDYRELEKSASNYCADVQGEKDYKQSIELAFDGLGDDDALIVFGSLYLASEIRTLLIEKII